jgi:hypothetical protein
MRVLQRSVFSLGIVYILNYPLLRSAVVADDLLNPFTLSRASGRSFWGAVGYGWQISLDGPSFRIFGNVLGSIFTWTLLRGAELGVSIPLQYALWRLILIFALALSCEALVSQISGSRPNRYVLIMTLSGLLHLRSIWSNDPVTSYLLAGYGTAVVLLLVLNWSSRLILNERPVAPFKALTIGVVILVATMYYELLLGLVPMVLLVFLVSERDKVFSSLKGRELFTELKRLSASVLLISAPVIVVNAVIRLTKSSDAATYGGTQIGSIGNSLNTMWLHVGSLIPVLSWAPGFSHLQVKEIRQELVSGGLITALVLGAIFLNHKATVRDASATPSEEIETDQKLSRGQLSLILASGALSIVLIQSITVKVQNETPQIGYVYTSHLPAISLLTVGLVMFSDRYVRIFLRSRARTHSLSEKVKAGMFVCMLFLTMSANFGINLSLARTLAVYSAPSISLLEAALPPSRSPMALRCSTILSWQGRQWPDYYRSDMVEGLQAWYLEAYDVPFCPVPRPGL